MKPQVTFIHAADLHLGAPFRGLRAVSDKWARRLIHALDDAYDRVISAAIERDVDFVVISGDSFDLSETSYGDYLHFVTGLNRLAEADIPVFIVAGNHDPLTSWQHGYFALPANTILFSADRPNFAIVRKQGKPLCIVGGRSYFNQTWPEDVSIAEGITRAAAKDALRPTNPDIDDVPFAVGIIHSGLNLDPYKAPTSPLELDSAGMDYWALGHVHIPYIWPNEKDPRIVFSGCIQGRDIKETGPRGVYEVTLRQDMPAQLSFIPTASVVWQQLSVDVHDCANVLDIQNKIVREFFRLNGKAKCEEMISRITLVGTTSLCRFLDNETTLEDLRESLNEAYPEFFCDAIINKTTMPLDRSKLASEGLFPSVFMRIASEQQEIVDDEFYYLEEEFSDRNFSSLLSRLKDVEDLASEAETLVLDLLTRDERS
ncbi:DNA repair exonuclease [Eggerthellaceae bacterium 3-80]|nr:DNA repair exonuclease [bacterium D16-34]